jgi:hypothetical protein
MSLPQFNPYGFITTDQIVILDTTNASATNGSLYVQGGLSTHDTFVDGHVMINNVKITPNLDDIIFEQESVLSNNVSEWTTIPDFEFNSSIALTFKAHVNVTVSAGIPKYAYWEINGLFKSPGGWIITSSFTGDLSGITFNILTESGIGKIQYKNTNTSGITTIRYRATTNAPPGTTPLGAASGIIENFNGPFTSNRFVYANTNRTLASTDIVYNANQLTIGGMSRLILENSNNFQNFSSGGSFTSMGDASIAQKLIVGGKIGILNTDPSYQLDVIGDINFSGDLYQNGNLFVSGGGGSSQWLSGTGGNLSYTKGNVGIGTTAPTFKVDINGNLRATTGITTGNIFSTESTLTNVISTNATSTRITTATLNASTGITTASMYASNGITSIFNSNTLGSIFTTSGNVGIGTTSPQYTLDINPSNVYNAMRVNGGSILSNTNGTVINMSPNDGAFGAIEAFTTGNFNVKIPLCLNPWGGNVGIGTISPSLSYKLDVNGPIHVDGIYSNYSNSTTGYLQIVKGWESNSGFIEFFQANGTRKGYIGYGGDTVAFQFIGEGSRNIELATNSVTHMTITSSGNIGLGTGTPSVRLQVMNNGGGQSTARIHASGNSITTDWPSGWGGGLNTFDISCAGIYYSTLLQRSDVRKKDNITTYTRGLSEVLQLRPVSFNWKEHNSTETQYGFIAQEVEQIIPELVNEDSEGYKNIKHAYIPILINAIKELNEKINEINARLS